MEEVLCLRVQGCSSHDVDAHFSSKGIIQTLPHFLEDYLANARQGGQEFHQWTAHYWLQLVLVDLLVDHRNGNEDVGTNVCQRFHQEGR